MHKLDDNVAAGDTIPCTPSTPPSRRHSSSCTGQSDGLLFCTALLVVHPSGVATTALGGWADWWWGWCWLLSEHEHESAHTHSAHARAMRFIVHINLYVLIIRTLFVRAPNRKSERERDWQDTIYFTSTLSNVRRNDYDDVRVYVIHCSLLSYIFFTWTG